MVVWLRRWVKVECLKRLANLKNKRNEKNSEKNIFG